MQKQILKNATNANMPKTCKACFKMGQQCDQIGQDGSKNAPPQVKIGPNMESKWSSWAQDGQEGGRRGAKSEARANMAPTNDEKVI